VGTLPALAPVPVHSSACSPSADAVAVVAARADMGSVPVEMYDGPVAAEDVVDDKVDTRLAEVVAACRSHVGQLYYFDSMRLRYLLEAEQRHWDLYSHAH